MVAGIIVGSLLLYMAGVGVTAAVLSRKQWDVDTEIACALSWPLFLPAFTAFVVTNKVIARLSAPKIPTARLLETK